MYFKGKLYFIGDYEYPEITSSTVEEVIEYINTHDIWSLDIETRKRSGWEEFPFTDPYTNEIVMLQIGDDEHQYIIDVRSVNITPICETINSSEALILGANLKFDLKHLLLYYNCFPKNIWDIMIVDMVRHCGKNTPKGFYSLVGVANRYLNLPDTNYNQLSLFDGASITKAIRAQFSDVGDNPFTLDHIHYGAMDVILPYKIYGLQKTAVEEEQLHVVTALENKYVRVLVKKELDGFYLDVGQWLKVYNLYSKKLEEKLKELSKFLEDYPDFKDINWNSSQQVVKLFKEIGIPTQIVDKENSDDFNTVYKDSVAKANISKYKQKFDIVAHYLEYKNLIRLTTSYGVKFLENVHPLTSRVHSDYYQIKATGRISSSKPNLQNIPGDNYPEYRGCFVPMKGNVLIVNDYSGQESRMLAEVAVEPSMIEFFEQGGGDIHSFIASKMFKTKVSKNIRPDLRFKGKITNFTIAYGGGAHKIADTMQIPIHEASKLIKDFYEAFPTLKPYFHARHEMALNLDYILIDKYTFRRSYHYDLEQYKYLRSTVERFKRRGWQIPPQIWGQHQKISASIKRNSQNYPIQGISGSMTKLASIMLLEELEKLPYKVLFCNTIHDEIVLECPEQHAKEVADILQQSMEGAGKKLSKKVKITASPEIATRWTH